MSPFYRRSPKGNLTNTKRGFTLLFAVLILSIIISVSGGIYALALRNVKVSMVQRDSQRAFSMASMAVECAIFWDRGWPEPNGLEYSPFASSTEGYNAPPPSLQRIASPLDHAGGALALPTRLSANPGIKAFCGNQNLFNSGALSSSGEGSLFRVDHNDEYAMSTFQLNYYIGGNCVMTASTTVHKYGDPIYKTVITSDGFSSCNVNDPRRVNRTFFIEIYGEGTK